MEFAGSGFPKLMYLVAVRTPTTGIPGIIQRALIQLLFWVVSHLTMPQHRGTDLESRGV